MSRDDEATSVEAMELTLAQELAEVVRDQSRSESTLTCMDSLEVDERALERLGQEELVREIQADERCEDIRLVRGSDGAIYLYSADHISDSYARILLRVEEDNPYELIASTVREESELYPRPTVVDLFREPTFGLRPDQVEQYVQELLQLAQYRDIKPIQASTGKLYLYSDRHLDGEWAKSLVEWEEVGKHESP